MSLPSSDMIERVVREVLAELELGLDAGAASDSGKSCGCAKAETPGTVVTGQSATERTTVPTSTPESCRPEPQPTAPDCLALAVRVVTLNDVQGRLDGIKRMVVGRGTIVTPAVMDELLRRNIAFERANSAKKSGSASRVRLAMVVARSEFDPAPLAAALAREGFVVEPSTSDCLIAAIEQLVQELQSPDTLAVLLSGHTAAGICLANREPGVRAITGVDAPSVATAAAAVGANLLAVDPGAVNFFQLKQMVAEFGRGGLRPCPEVFKRKLA